VGNLQFPLGIVILDVGRGSLRDSKDPISLAAARHVGRHLRQARRRKNASFEIRAGAVNSRPPNGEDKFGPTVIGGAFMALQQAHPIETSGSPTAQ
jgi:hypothetical protein